MSVFLVAAALAANAKRIELWRAEPAGYVEQAQGEIHRADA